MHFISNYMLATTRLVRGSVRLSLVLSLRGASSSPPAPGPGPVRSEVASFLERVKARQSPPPSPNAADDLAGLEVRAWEQSRQRGVLVARVNAFFSLAAFPVHVYGFMVGLNVWLLAWPALFSVCWLAYSVVRAQRTVTALTLLPGARVALSTRSFFGAEAVALEAPLSALRVQPQTETQRKRGIVYVDVFHNRASAATKAESTRYLVEVHSGHVLDPRAFKSILR